MLTHRRLVLSTPRAKKLLWAAVTGDRNIVLVGGIAARTTPSVPALRHFLGSTGQRITIEVVPEIRRGSRARRWEP